MVDQELEPGLRSLAAPIHDPSGTVVAAVNVSAPATRGSMDRIREELLPPLLDCARRIEEDLRVGQPAGPSRARNA
jgi:IclR family pca regulon transcriptional regulator